MTRKPVTRLHSVVAKNACNVAKNNLASLPINVFSHLVSNKHEKKHRFLYGLCTAFIGVVVAKSGGHAGVYIVEVVADFSGYFLHGIGLIPFIDHFSEKLKEGINKVN